MRSRVYRDAAAFSQASASETVSAVGQVLPDEGDARQKAIDAGAAAVSGFFGGEVAGLVAAAAVDVLLAGGTVEAAASAAIAVGTSAGVGAAGGAGLGSILGPIGAMIGVVVGILSAVGFAHGDQPFSAPGGAYAGDYAMSDRITQAIVSQLPDLDRHAIAIEVTDPASAFRRAQQAWLAQFPTDVYVEPDGAGGLSLSYEPAEDQALHDAINTSFSVSPYPTTASIPATVLYALWIAAMMHRPDLTMADTPALPAEYETIDPNWQAEGYAQPTTIPATWSLWLASQSTPDDVWRVLQSVCDDLHAAPHFGAARNIADATVNLGPHLGAYRPVSSATANLGPFSAVGPSIPSQVIGGQRRPQVARAATPPSSTGTLLAFGLLAAGAAYLALR